MLEAVSAEHVRDYRIRIEFSSGERGVVDLEDALWGPVFEPVRDPEVIQRFQISPVLHTVAWDNDADLAPEFLRDKMVEQMSSADR